jgi:translocation and assembly module TamB
MYQDSADNNTPANRLRRAARWLLRGVAAIFLVILVVLSLLSATLSTHRGSHWLLASMTDFLNTNTQTFQYTSAEGTFLRGMNLNGVSWRTGNNQIRVEQLHSRWNPMTLLEGEFNLESLRIAGLQVDWFSNPDAEPGDAPMIHVWTVQQSTTMTRFTH